MIAIIINSLNLTLINVILKLPEEIFEPFEIIWIFALVSDEIQSESEPSHT